VRFEFSLEILVLIWPKTIGPVHS